VSEALLSARFQVEQVGDNWTAAEQRLHGARGDW
jgi:hypothetical protein